MITILSCTNRNGAVTLRIADYYKKLLKEQNTEAEIINLQSLPRDFTYTALYENMGKHTEFNQLAERFINSKKIVVIAPEYNGSFPGVLKSFIDGLPYPAAFQNKKIALVGLSSGVQGGALALSHLNDIFSFLEANVMGMQVKLMYINQYFRSETLDQKYHELLQKQINLFLEF